MPSERILIIDTSSQTIDFLTRSVLAPHGYQAMVAHSGEEGLTLARESQPDLVLLDLNLPAMSGLAALEAFAAAGNKIPIIVMTVQGPESLAVQAFRMGVKDYLLKPFTAAEMLDSIERALTEVRLRKERDELTGRLVKSNHELAQRVKELNTLFGVGKSVTALLDQERLLSRLVEAAIFLTNAEEGSLLLLDAATDELYMVAACGIDERVARSFRLKVTDSLAGQVIASGQPLILAGSDFTRIKTSYLVRSVMYVPLKIGGNISGVLTVDNRYQQWDFTTHHLRLLSTLADYAAISLQNAQLFNQVEGERSKLAAVLTELDEPVIVVAEDSRRVIVANAALKQIFGLSADEVEGRPVNEVIFNPALLKLVASAAESGQSHRDEILLSDGRTFSATLTPVPGVGLAVVMKDVTYFKELDRLKSEFVSTVSHDLRAPLTSINEYAHMLAKAGQLNDKQVLFAQRISAGIGQITALIDNLLDLSAIELGVDPAQATVEFCRLAAEVVAEFQEKAGRGHQQLVFHPAGQAAPVAGSAPRLRQVVTNLLDNALKYTPSGGQVSVIVQVNGGEMLLKVEDNGPGIPAPDLPFVFDKFFRARSTRHDSGPRGTGLGLSICKSVVEKYSGHIWVESQPGQGSVFTVSLPLVGEPVAA